MAKKKTSPKKGDKARTDKTTSTGEKTRAAKVRTSKARATRGLEADILKVSTSGRSAGRATGGSPSWTSSMTA
jgi:hypothetical protein